jgi:hypothetical protein
MFLGGFIMIQLVFIGIFIIIGLICAGLEIKQ